MAEGRLEWRTENEELNGTLAGALLAPTRVYVKPILNLLRDFGPKGITRSRPWCAVLWWAGS